MKILIPTFLLATLFTAVACNNNDKTTTDAPAVPASQPVNAGVTDTLNKGNTNTIINEPQAPASLQQPANAGVVLNPPHGQPGHDCAVEVGKPLNSVPASTNQPVTSGPVPAPTTPLPNTITPNSGQVRINPAHGQPGHRCDIAVGAAL